MRAVGADHVVRAADLLLNRQLRGDALPRLGFRDVVARDDAADLLFRRARGHDDRRHADCSVPVSYSSGMSAIAKACFAGSRPRNHAVGLRCAQTDE